MKFFKHMKALIEYNKLANKHLSLCRDYGKLQDKHIALQKEHIALLQESIADEPEYDEIDAGCDRCHEDSDEAMIAEIEDGE